LSSRALVVLPKNLIALLFLGRNSCVAGFGGFALPTACAHTEWNGEIYVSSNSSTNIGKVGRRESIEPRHHHVPLMLVNTSN
jgi:hypothetical protein